jgi:outer membrane receptor protein involved in Fe transport
VDVPNPTPSGFVPRQNLDALLHELTLFAIFNHRSGFFAEAQTTWHAQHSDGYSPALADEDLWQIHLFGGYRFAQRRAELRIGVLNVTDQNYRLNPLNLISELPRERTFVTSLRFYF